MFGPTSCVLRKLAILLALPALASGLVFTSDALAVPRAQSLRVSVVNTPGPGVTLNVKDYGATGDGVTDDAQSIRDCIDACYEVGGGTVYIPAGTYRLVTGRDLPDTDNAVMKVHVALRSGVIVAGDGVGKTILVGEAPEDGLSVMGATDDNVVARDLTAMIPAADKEDTWKSGLKLCGVDGGTFTNIRMEYTGTASNCVGCSNLTYTNCVSANTKAGFMCDEQPADGYPTSHNITYNSCESYGSTGRGIGCGFEAYVADGKGKRVSLVTYNNCYAHDNRNTGFYSKWSYRVTYRACRSDNNGSWGFYLESAKDYLVTSCTARGNHNSRFRYVSSTPRRQLHAAPGLVGLGLVVIGCAGLVGLHRAHKPLGTAAEC